MKITLVVDGKTTTYRSFSKRKASGLVTTMSSRKGGIIEGHARVEYRRGEYNEFDFVGDKDYRKKIAPCIEDSLMDYLGLAHV